MSFSLAVFSWIHLRCDWSMNDGAAGTDFRHFELRNLSYKMTSDVGSELSEGWYNYFAKKTNHKFELFEYSR